MCPETRVCLSLVHNVPGASMSLDGDRRWWPRQREEVEIKGCAILERSAVVDAGICCSSRGNGHQLKHRRQEPRGKKHRTRGRANAVRG